MGKRSQIGKSREAAGILMPISRTTLSRRMRGREWRRDLLLSRLFRTCITLQTSLNRRFLRFRMTVQEASVLLRCVEARKISLGELSVILGRDRGTITRFIDRLEASRLVTRDISLRDGRISVIRPTRKGKQIARALAGVFEKIRKELFVGILESDEFRLGRVLPQLDKNATRIGSRQRHDPGRRGRVRSHRRRKECGPTYPPRSGEELVTASPNGRAAKTLAAELRG
jgi:DNA-binding MarR family transcriptional regulator